MVTNCTRCNKRIISFIGYIPGVGEVCLECFQDYMVEDETRQNADLASKKKGENGGGV